MAVAAAAAPCNHLGARLAASAAAAAAYDTFVNVFRLPLSRYRSTIVPFYLPLQPSTRLPPIAAAAYGIYM